MLGHRHQLFHGQAAVLKHVHVTSHCVAGYLKGTTDTLYPHSRRIAAENVFNLTDHFVIYLIADQDDTQKYKKILPNTILAGVSFILTLRGQSKNSQWGQ